MDPHGEKPSGDGYHANGQSDSEVWSEPVTEPAEPRRPRLSFSDTYVEIECAPTHTHQHVNTRLILTHQLHLAGDSLCFPFTLKLVL